MSTATLEIGSFSSTCSACRKNAFPDETHHYTVSYGHEEIRGVNAAGIEYVFPAKQGEPGCGAEFTVVTSVYMDPLSVQATKRLRPDLPYEGDVISGG